MTKKEAYYHLIQHRKSILCCGEAMNLRKSGLNNAEILSLYLKKFNIDIQANSYLQLRTTLTEETGNCGICGKQTKLKNAMTLNSMFNQFCSRECELKWRSNRQKENNTSNRIKDRKKWKENLSKKLKQSIIDGKFTPDVTNSWCNSRIKVKVRNIVINVRSSWEAYFQLKNPSFLYEKIRIPYMGIDGKSHSYIVDFVDDFGNLYEIKPSSNIGASSEKFLAAKEYCENNNVFFNIITEDYFNELDISIVNEQPDEEKLKRLLSRYENKKNN